MPKKTACKPLEDYLEQTHEEEIEQSSTCKNCGEMLIDYGAYQMCSACGNLHDENGEEL